MARTLLILLAGIALALASGTGGQVQAQNLRAPFPDATETADIAAERIAFPTANPFTLGDVGNGDVPEEEAVAYFYRARATTAQNTGQDTGQDTAARHPAVVLLHGAGGVRGAREHRYGREFAAMGIHAVVVDAFGARRDLARSFTNRLIHITEAMLIHDAFAALDWLAARSDVDPERVAFIGFSYGGMASLYAAHEQVTDTYRDPDEPRFAAHVAYYAPCIARFEDTRANGAPLLMMWGTGDEIVDGDRCRENIEALRAGGGRVETAVFDGAAHNWDGGFAGGWRAPRGLRHCDLTVSESGQVRDTTYFIPLLDTITRKAILGLCADTEGYLIKANPAVRERSNAILAAFLAPILTPEAVVSE